MQETALNLRLSTRFWKQLWNLGVDEWAYDSTSSLWRTFTNIQLDLIFLHDSKNIQNIYLLCATMLFMKKAIVSLKITFFIKLFPFTEEYIRAKIVTA